MTNVRVWALPIVLALLSSVCAGLALEGKIEAVGLAEAQGEVSPTGARQQAEPAGVVETPPA